MTTPPPAARYAVEIPTMKSLFIEVRRGDMTLATATGFLAAADKDSHCALITNRHVVTGRNQVTDQCLNKNGAVPDSIVIHFHKSPLDSGEWKQITLPLYRPDATPFWFEHPRLGSAADVVALNLTWGSDVVRLPYYMDTKLDRSDLVVGPAETVSVIGFPFGLSSVARFPIWATGFLAQELSLMTPERPWFLIDCRTRQGQSGSAVIAYRPGGHRALKGGRVTTSFGGTVWEFLGIYSGRVNAESDLGRVWNASVIEDTLAAAAEDSARRAANPK
jgi:hypothetical protein